MSAVCYKLLGIYEKTTGHFQMRTHPQGQESETRGTHFALASSSRLSVLIRLVMYCRIWAVMVMGEWNPYASQGLRKLYVSHSAGHKKGQKVSHDKATQKEKSWSRSLLPVQGMISVFCYSTPKGHIGENTPSILLFYKPNDFCTDSNFLITNLLILPQFVHFKQMRMVLCSLLAL